MDCASLDDTLSSELEHGPLPSERIKCLEELAKRGVHCEAASKPLFPGLTDLTAEDTCDWAFEHGYSGTRDFLISYTVPRNGLLFICILQTTVPPYLGRTFPLMESLTGKAS